MRLLIKGLWKKHGQSWDEELSPENEIYSKDWASELSHMNEMALKRLKNGTRLKQLIVDQHDVEIERTFFGWIRQLFCHGCKVLTKNNRCLWRTESQKLLTVQPLINGDMSKEP